VTRQQDHVVLKCSGTDCGMRYPSPADDPRRSACPLCESAVHQVDSYTDAPPLPTESTAPGGEIVAVFDNIRSALNVGTMLRSSDGVAIDRVYLGGLTASANNPKVIKTALGAEQTVATVSTMDTLDAIATLRDQHFQIWAVDYTATSIALQTITERPPKLAVVVGNEVAGVDPAILKLADAHIHLDMLGTKSTVNVGVAYGTIAYWLKMTPLAGDA